VSAAAVDSTRLWVIVTAIMLAGCRTQSEAPVDAPTEVHRTPLSATSVPGLRAQHVEGLPKFDNDRSLIGFVGRAFLVADFLHREIVLVDLGSLSNSKVWKVDDERRISTIVLSSRVSVLRLAGGSVVLVPVTREIDDEHALALDPDGGVRDVLRPAGAILGDRYARSRLRAIQGDASSYWFVGGVLVETAVDPPWEAERTSHESDPWSRIHDVAILHGGDLAILEVREKAYEPRAFNLYVKSSDGTIAGPTCIPQKLGTTLERCVPAGGKCVVYGSDEAWLVDPYAQRYWKIGEVPLPLEGIWSIGPGTVIAVGKGFPTRAVILDVADGSAPVRERR
jgi:hypothetical protein